ncbi:MAG: 3-deoxy-manno-octulosonate cytidylyltransferase [Bacteroidales bacterium]|nr:3-deoxy-manno-octulosonate cytidylyltransferase [Bacteroidales bacterium]
MKIIGIIPARYGSTRYPGKPLANIHGKSMIQRVCEQALLSQALDDVIVATDDERIYRHVTSAGFKAIMTSSEHRSGTERCHEALLHWNKRQEIPADAVINIQGDEPFIRPEQISIVASLLKQPGAGIATLARNIVTQEEIFSPHIVKVAFTSNMEALYFSRAPIPYLQGVEDAQWHKNGIHYKHIGIYGYLADNLESICSLPVCILEVSESLEQLRWLHHGHRIKIGITEFDSIAVDTPEDLLKITNIA